MAVLQFKKEVRGLLTVEQWDVLVALGKVREPPPSINWPKSGISCSAVDHVTGRPCGAHMWDRIETVVVYGELRRRLRCDVCGNNRETRSIAE